MNRIDKRELLARSDAALRGIRETPVVPLDQHGMRLFAKLEYCNPVGSLKERPALWILRSAIHRGEIDPGTTIVESSSGNFASALAFYTHLLGLSFIPVIDPNITNTYESFLRRLCPRVEKVGERDATGGFLDVRLQRVRSLLAEIENSYWTNQYGNEDAIEAHYRFTGEEICGQLSSLDYAFIGVSTAATIAGISRRLKERFPKVKIIAVDAEGSVIFGGPPKPRYIAGIGASVRPKLVDKALIDDVVRVPEVDTIRGCRELLWRHGLIVGGSSGSCYAALQKYVPTKGSGTPPTVLFLCADRGTAYAETIFDDTWAAKMGA